MKSFFKTFLLIFILLSACRKPDSYFQGNASLRFSVDTLVFDTVFTTVGSITKKIKVYNDLEEDLLINQINLAGSGSSPFRLNIDGLQGDIASDVILRSRDSLYIFVETTIDPNNTNNPLIHTDSIVFITNGNMQDVDLVAWGQDAHFYYSNSYVVFVSNDPQIQNDTLFYHSISEPTVWSNDKPHVIYGLVVIENGASLFDFLYISILPAPLWLMIIIPISSLISVIIIFNRFSNDQETLMFQLSGANIFFLIKPILLISFFNLILLTIINVYIIPNLNI